MGYYDYRCARCKEVHELKRDLKDMETEPNPKCPKCGLRMSRVYTPLNNLDMPTGGGQGMDDR